MALPLIVIVGRPNVGKSSLLNAIARERIRIVDARAGITRDRVSAIIEHQEQYLEIVDTGGIGIVDDDHLETHVEDQIRFAIGSADLIVFVVDIIEGLTPLDQTVAELLRRAEKPVILVANKADAPKHEAGAGEFHRLGYGEPLPIAALHGRGRSELLDRVLQMLGPRDSEGLRAPVMKLAIIGKRNASKSTFVNALAGEERVIVSEIPGTTRDAVDVRFERDGQPFIAIDTAGVRKKSSMTDIDFYSYTRALRSIQRADVVLLLIDAMVPVSEVDLKLAAATLEEYKPVVIAINKWDLARDMAGPTDFGDYLTGVLPALRHAPIVFTTARSGEKVNETIDVALSLHRQAQTRLTTGRLNAALQEILALRGPSAKHGTRPVKIYYATQVGTRPLRLKMFVNDPDLVLPAYRKFLEKRLREKFGLEGAPLVFIFAARERGE